jgi:hypothetical protein
VGGQRGGRRDGPVEPGTGGRARREARDRRRVRRGVRLGERAYHRAGEDAGDGEPGPGGERGDGARGRGRRGLLDGHLRAFVRVRDEEGSASVSVPRQPCSQVARVVPRKVQGSHLRGEVRGLARGEEVLHGKRLHGGTQRSPRFSSQAFVTRTRSVTGQAGTSARRAGTSTIVQRASFEKCPLIGKAGQGKKIPVATESVRNFFLLTTF